MKTGDHKILGNIDQLQTDQYFQLASGTEDAKLSGEAFPQGSVRYNSTIDRMEGVVRSTDINGGPHPGRWSPFVIPSEIGACDPDAADMFASYVGTVLNSAEDAKILFINLRYSTSLNLPSFPTGRFLPSNCSKDANDPANVIVSVDNLETCTIATNPNNPRINVTQNENVSCCSWKSCPTTVPTQSSMVLDLFNYFDIPTAERRNFYITPYACIKGFNMTNSGGHCYNVLGGKIFLQPITSNPEDPRFGQFRVRLERAQLTDLLSFSVYLTINRFDNFVPTCKNPPPIEPPPAMPTDIVIHCTDVEYNTNTMKDLNIKDWIANEYWQWSNQPVNVTVKVHPGATVGAGPGGVAGINASGLPSTSTITIDVSGTVLGAGGSGGNGEGNILSPATLLGVEHPAENGGDGGTAILGDDNQLTINNTTTGMIIGGSGGGAGARGVRTFNGELLAGASGSGGQARGPGGVLVYGGWKSEDDMMLDSTFSDGNNGRDGNFTSGGVSHDPAWRSSSFLIPGNFAAVEGYGTFNRTNAQGGDGGINASAGENSTSLATPSQGVILLKDSTNYTGSFRIANNRYNFKQCPSDTRTCWDGSVKNRRSDNNCEFDDCPDPPLLDFVRDSVTEENTIKMDYQLLNHGNGNTSRTVQIRMVLDDGIDFPDPTAVPIVVQLVNENRDAFHIPNGFNDGKGRTFTWNYNADRIVELSFDIEAKDLDDAGDLDTILDGSPYFGDIKLKMLGFSNQTVAQVELQVNVPSTVVNLDLSNNDGVNYERTSDDGNTLWNNKANHCQEFTFDADIVQPSGVTIDVTGTVGNFILKKNGDWLGVCPHTITPTDPHSTDHTKLEKIPTDNYTVQPIDYIDSYASYNGVDQNTVWSDVAPIKGPTTPGEQLMVECWFRVSNGNNQGIIFNKEQEYELEVRRVGAALQLRVATWQNSGPDTWGWELVRSDLDYNIWYHVALILTATTTGYNATVRQLDTIYYNKDFTNTLSTKSSNLRFGARDHDGVSGWFAGDMTEFRVWRSDSADLNDLFDASRIDLHSIRTPAYPNGWPGLPYDLVKWKPQVKDANLNGQGSSTAANNPTFTDARDAGFTAGPFPDLFNPVDGQLNLQATWINNSTAVAESVQRTFDFVKTTPMTMFFRDSVDLTANPQGPVSKMFLADLDDRQLNLEIYGDGLDSPTITITGLNPGAGYLSLQHTIHEDDTNTGNDNMNWDGTHTYDVDQGNYSLKIKIRVATPNATNDLRGIGSFAGRLQITVDGETQTYDIDANQTQGNLLTKQFSAADAGWNTALDMQLNRTGLVQLGADGLSTAADINFTLTGGGGGSGGSTVDNFGGQGIVGKTISETRTIPAVSDVTIRVGTGGEAGGVANSAGGRTGSIGRTGGNSDTATVDGVVYRSGGGGGGFTEVDSDSNNFVKLVSAGGAGGSGAIDFGVNNNVYPAVRNGRCVWPSHAVSLADSIELMQVAPGDAGSDTVQIHDSFREPGGGRIVGQSGWIKTIQQNDPVVGSIGGGGGGVRGGIAGYSGQGGDQLQMNLTPAGEAGATGAVTVQVRGYTDNVDDLVSLTALAGLITPPPALDNVLGNLPAGVSRDEVVIDQIQGAIPRDTPLTVSAIGNGDPMGAFYDNSGNLIETDDDSGPGLMPAFSFPNGLSAGDYWFILSKYHNPPGPGPRGPALYTNDNFGLFETDKICDFSVDFEFTGDDGTVFGTYQHTQDTTTKHVICACRVV